MYIKEIKANGFKSFADKINIELGKNFTGIVGPNGSGKSNIVDAVKWVLGEQSVKTLRSENMTDVIFNGSKNRSASSSASVTIVFDNTDKHLPLDYDEVSLKRIVYRSGENEYYLNGEKVRLKDISNLLSDSFSSKESFNIIGQGQINDIIGERPEKRRAIIEEAAGVLKYKKRKEESLRKLEKTHENIERVDFIIRELSERLEPLRIESEKAKEYVSIKEELESVDIALMVKDIEKYSDIYEKNRIETEQLNKELSKNTSTNSKEEVELEKKKSEVLKLSESINSIQKSIIESNNNLADLNRKKELIKERNKYNTEDIKVKSRLINIKEDELSLKNDLTSLNNDKSNISKEIDDINKELTTYMSEYKTLDTKLNSANGSFADISKQEIVTNDKINVISTSLENNAKLPYAVRCVLDNPRLNGIKDVIGNIIETDNKYSTAIDVSLGATSSVIVIDDEKSAHEAINYLKDNKKGRATFYPLTVIKGRKVDEDTVSILKNIPSFIGVASSLVKYDSIYEDIVNNVLGNIIVVEDMKSLDSIGKKINYKYRIVTLDGEISHVGGSLTGGSIKSDTGIMSDKFELERLKTLLKGLSKEKESIEKEIKEYTDEIEIVKNKIYKLNTDLSSLKGNLSSIENSINNKTISLNNIKEEIKSLSKNSNEDIENEVTSVMEEYYKEEENKNKLSKDLEVKIKQRKNIEESINDLELSIKNKNSTYNSINNKLRSLEVESAKSSVLLDNLLNVLSENYNITYEKAKEKYELTMEEYIARNMVNELKNRLKLLGEVNTLSIEEFDRVNKRYEFLDTQKKDLEDSEKNLLGIINEMDETMEIKFKETFEMVNEEFNKVFKKLFKGGEAKLVMTNPDDILETGIDINAIPPGKKLKVSQLSGGEMTLTAISLLFAIMNLKDVPFAILDEIEAPLDEANVEKFGEYISNYRNKIQMILITHKKKTMEFVDTLFGITMQESGVSKLVSVKLEEIKEK